MPDKITLYAALAAAQREFPTIPLNAVNPHFRNRYADLAGILSAVRPALNKHGLYLSFDSTTTETGDIMVAACIRNADGETHCATVTLPRVQNTAQGIGSVLTYGRRYAVAMLLGIAADDDDDGEAASKQPVQAQKQAQPSKPTRAPANAPQNGATQATGQTDGQSMDDNPFEPPTDEELAVLGTWAKPADAYEWAVSIGACDNVHEARNSFEKIAMDAGGLKKSTAGRVYVGFYRRQMQKLDEIAEAYNSPR